MATISLRIPDALLAEVTLHSKQMHIPRTEYIRKSLISMNHQADLELRRKRLMQASIRVRKESMAINNEFDAMEYSES
ncbi:CopG family transcriptional regulator [Mariprofundus sp. EBB-1]|uniref:CopG family transcriptional regulator n=1 Tax=Mariprofundus sp. EBB-1 TaxID=2650971 RepID=UPI000EF21C47|nr:CopG family transcriptional regulator [Mariprofundus sp. EBB-1]RLL49698.1 CopG family transcriptional regulator [Mariprofundus sp. EBB-1]